MVLEVEQQKNGKGERKIYPLDGILENRAGERVKPSDARLGEKIAASAVIIIIKAKLSLCMNPGHTSIFRTNIILPILRSLQKSVESKGLHEGPLESKIRKSY